VTPKLCIKECEELKERQQNIVFTEDTNRIGSGGKDKKKILPSSISDYNTHYWRRHVLFFISLGFFGVLYVDMIWTLSIFN
jgi:hypothetical protein